MPYGFGGGFAAGLDSGIGHGREIGETRMRREALQQEQVKEKVALMQGYINDGLKNLSEIVAKSPQRDEKVETVIQNYQSGLTEAAQLMEGLGPQGEQAGKMAMQTINNIIPNLQTQAEAFTAKRVGEVQGAFGAVDALSGGAAPSPAPQSAGMTGMPGTPGAPSVGPGMPATPSATPVSNPGTPGLPTPADPTVPTQLGDGTAQANDVMSRFEQLGYTRKESFEMMLGGNPPDKAAGGEKMGADMVGRVALMDTGLSGLKKETAEGSGITNMELLSKPSTWNMMQAVGLPSRLAGGELQKARNAALQAVRGAFYTLTGASAPESETAELYSILLPAYGDKDDVAKAKLKSIFEYVGRAKNHMQNRSGETIPVEQALLIAGMPPDKAASEAQSIMTAQKSEPEGIGSSAAAGGSAQSYASEEEAAAAGLPDGAKVIINGVRGTWRN